MTCLLKVFRANVATRRRQDWFVRRLLKMLRADQRKEQVNEKAERHDSDNEVFHGSDPIEGIGVANTDDKETNDYRHVYEIHHGSMLLRLDGVVVQNVILFLGVWDMFPFGCEPKSKIRARNTASFQVATS